MCENTGKLKFCTCESEKFERKGWVWELWLVPREPTDSLDWMSLSVGRCTYFNFSEQDEGNLLVIWEALTIGNPFDFAYSPQRFDYLVVRYYDEKGKEQHIYEFHVIENNEWMYLTYKESDFGRNETCFKGFIEQSKLKPNNKLHHY